MADQNCSSPDMCFKDAVCTFDTGRVYDSCCDRDCLEDLRVMFNTEGQAQIRQTPATSAPVRLKSSMWSWMWNR